MEIKLILADLLDRWIDMLLPFGMKIVHQPGRISGIADYLSKHLNNYNENEKVRKNIEKVGL